MTSIAIPVEQTIVDVVPFDAETRHWRRPLAGLEREHYTQLVKKWRISPKVVRERNYRTHYSRWLYAPGGHGQELRGMAGWPLKIPVQHPRGYRETVVYQVYESKPADDGFVRYVVPGSELHLDMPPRCIQDGTNINKPLYVTDLPMKADALASQGFTAVAAICMDQWVGVNRLGGQDMEDDWGCVRLEGREVILILPGAVTTNPKVRTACDRLRSYLEGRGARVTVVDLPNSPLNYL